MPTLLILDAAFPPVPNQWITDMDTVGADGGLVYVYGGYTNYSLQHVLEARQRNKVVIPCVVPGNSPPSANEVLRSLDNYGFTGGPVVIDLETGSEPSDGWLTFVSGALRDSGYQPDRYGTVSELGKYTREGVDWVADWLRAGVLDPVPAMPAGWSSWQFVDDVRVNGNVYDASIIDSSLVEPFGGDFLMALTDAQQKQLLNDVHAVRVLLSNGTAGSTVDWTGTPDGGPTFVVDELTRARVDIAAVQAAVVALAGGSLPAPTLKPVLDAIATLKSELDNLTLRRAG